VNQDEALSIAADAAELCAADRLDEAEQRYREAIARADPRHYRTPDIHSQYAGVLNGLNRWADAGAQYERALQLELRNDPDECQPALLAARYLLGEHYLRLGEADSARRVVAPSLAAPRPLAWIVEAEALFLSGSTADARAAAWRALALATDAQRERIRERLAELLDAPVE
jgi:tetratricopeptide (TPR) repeat protein